VVREKLPFPGILGRACFALRSACRRASSTIRCRSAALKRIADDNDTGLWRQYSKQLPPTGKKAAVIGAGPAGLTAAYYLAKKGHAVTVFDALPPPAAWRATAFPRIACRCEVIDREVAEVEKLGVKFQYNTRIENVDDLFGQGYEAVVHRHRRQGGDALGMPGDDLPNVIDSPTFLRAATLGLGTPRHGIGSASASR
jgi:formate dehydrogenase beta subunit